MAEEIWKTISETAVELSPDRIGIVSDNISRLSSSEEFEKVRSSFGFGVKKSMIDRLGQTWGQMPTLQPGEVASALRAASSTAEFLKQRESVEMVWTGPASGLVPSRHTEQVLLQVIKDAKFSIFIVSFVAHGIGVLIQALRGAIDRGVKIDILLESSKAHGGKIDIDSIETFKKEIPAANIYSWNSISKSSEKATGAVHAKCAVADGQLAFITSANLTNAAMERNMELGVLVKGGELPSELHRHLEALISTKIIEKVDA